MSEGTTRTGFRVRTALIGAMAVLTIAGFGMAADEVKAISPDDPAIKASRAMVTVTGCKGAQVSIEARERDLISLHNAQRRRIGAPQLCVEPALQRSAEAHARDMITREYFSHTSPEGKTSGDRAIAAGYTGEGMGENIASTAAEDSPQEVFGLWMNSWSSIEGTIEPNATWHPIEGLDGFESDGRKAVIGSEDMAIEVDKTEEWGGQLYVILEVNGKIVDCASVATSELEEANISFDADDPEDYEESNMCKLNWAFG